MTDAWAAVISAIAAMLGAGIAGALSVKAANKLTNYRIEKLEEKLDEVLGERTDVNNRVRLLEWDMRQVKCALRIDDRLQHGTVDGKDG